MQLKRLLLFLFLPIPTLAQTAVTGTITDTDSMVWANAPVVVSFQPTPACPQTSGQTTVKATTNSSGVYSVTVPVACLNGASWAFTATANTTNGQRIPSIFSTAVVVSGATQTVNLTPPGPRFPYALNSFGYGPVELDTVPAQPGSIFYNTTPGQGCQQWSGTTWASCGGGGGGATLPSNAIVFGLTSTTSRAVSTSDMSTLLGTAGSSGTACTIANSLYSPQANGCFTPAITNSGTGGQFGYYAATGNTISPDTFFNFANSTHIDTAANGLNTTQVVAAGSQPQVYNMAYANDGTTGSIPLFLNKIASTGVLKATTSDTAIPVFIVASSSDDGASVVSNNITLCQSGTTGNACIVQGRGTVTFDAGGGTAGDFCVASSTVAGTCHDQSNPAGQFCVGRIVANVAASGTGLIDTTFCTLQNPAGNGTVSNASTAHQLGVYTTTGTTISPDASLDDGGTAANTLTYAGTAGVAAAGGFNATGTQTITSGGVQVNSGGYRIYQSGGALNFSVGTTSFPMIQWLTTGQRMISTVGYGFSSSTTNAAAVDTIGCRGGAAGLSVVESAASCTNTLAGATGIQGAAAFEVGGATFTSNAGCTDTALTGGATGGHFTVGVNTACTTVITMGSSATAAHGWVCTARDITTPANLVQQSATTTTTVTLGGTFSTSDVIWFTCGAV